MRPGKLLVASTILFAASFASLAGASGSASVDDPASDECFLLFVAPFECGETPLGCSDPRVDLRQMTLASDGTFLNATLTLRDADGTPACAVPGLGFQTLYGVWGLHILKTGYGGIYLDVYQRTDGSHNSCVAVSWGPDSGSECHAATLTDTLAWSMPLAGTLGGFAYDLRATTFGDVTTSAYEYVEPVVAGTYLGLQDRTPGYPRTADDIQGAPFTT